MARYVLNVAVSGKHYANVEFRDVLALSENEATARAGIIARGIKTQFPHESITFQLTKWVEQGWNLDMRQELL